ncbi:hypothetical protein AMECASPLE_024868 [Ameca splendens]|uniref:Ig-like domain-containing protein n=1 Tax=Ameca splendens TaxID=208324 RepID=A0ABV0ZFC0_9TELE
MEWIPLNCIWACSFCTHGAASALAFALVAAALIEDLLNLPDDLDPNTCDMISKSLVRKNSKVLISRVRVEDSGNYTCLVENSLGQENATSIITVQILTTTTPSPGVSHVRRCNDSEKAYCANGGDCYFIHGINQLSCNDLSVVGHCTTL